MDEPSVDGLGSGGVMTNQLICHGGCDTIRERDEPFYTVSLEVKGKSHLEESLESYVAGELLSDFNCSTCKRRVEVRLAVVCSAVCMFAFHVVVTQRAVVLQITKRACLGTLTPNIIFHLKRFELNFETFQVGPSNSSIRRQIARTQRADGLCVLPLHSTRS